MRLALGRHLSASPRPDNGADARSTRRRSEQEADLDVRSKPWQGAHWHAQAGSAGKRAAQATGPTLYDTSRAIAPCTHAVGPHSNTSIQIWLIEDGMLAGVILKFCKQLLRAVVLLALMRVPAFASIWQVDQAKSLGCLRWCGHKPGGWAGV